MRFLLLSICCWWLIQPVLSQEPAFNEKEVRATLSELKNKRPSVEQVDLQLRLASRMVEGVHQPSPAVDSAFVLVTQAQQLSRQLHYAAGEGRSSFQLSHIAEINHQYDQGKIAAADAIRIFTRLSAYNDLGEAYVSMWSITTLAGPPNSDIVPMDHALLRISYLDSAAKSFDLAGNKMRLADCYRELGDLYYITNQLLKSQDVLQKALHLYQEIKYPRLMAVYDLLGSLNFSLGDYEKGVEYGLKAVQTAESLGDTSLSMCTYYNRIGSAYLELNDTAKSRFYFDKALQIAIKFDDQPSIANVACNISEQFIRSGRPQLAVDLLQSITKRYVFIRDHFKIPFSLWFIPAYVDLKAYGQAAPYVTFIEKQAERKDFDPEVYALIYTAIIPYFVATQDKAKALQYAAAFKTITRILDRVDYTVKYSLIQFKVDSATGNFVSAIEHLQRYKSIKDSLFTEAKSRQIAHFSVLYETEKKEKNIQALQRAGEIQQDHLRQADTRERITLIGAALIFLIAGLLFYAYRLKKKSNAALLQQQQEIEEKNQALSALVIEKDWLMREIHHRVKNNLHMVVGLLASQAEYIKGKEALDAINESQHRVQAMSIIHQKLYQTDNLSFTNMPDYLRELTDYLQGSFDKSIPVRFMLDIEKVDFPLSLSIPLGLIVNEAVTNAFKYAFAGRNDGEIRLLLKQTETGFFQLIIHDNGVGFLNPADLHKSASLGVSLIKGLSDDIKGRLKISNDNGLKIEIIFPLPEKSDEHPR